VSWSCPGTGQPSVIFREDLAALTRTGCHQPCFPKDKCVLSARLCAKLWKIKGCEPIGPFQCFLMVSFPERAQAKVSFLTPYISELCCPNHEMGALSGVTMGAGGQWWQCGLTCSNRGTRSRASGSLNSRLWMASVRWCCHCHQAPWTDA
jgi:hypothetical protein